MSSARRASRRVVAGNDSKRYISTTVLFLHPPNQVEEFERYSAQGPKNHNIMDSSPSKSHHHIVFLQGDFIQTPDFQLPDPHSYTSTIYPQTSLAELHERIHDASIIVLSALKVDATALSPEVSPNLKLVVAVATGYDCIDLDACRARGIVVCNTPNCNVEAVSEHAIGLYFTTRRKMVDLHALTRAGEWPRKRTLMFQMLDRNRAPPLSCQDEVAGIIGNGGVGQ